MMAKKKYLMLRSVDEVLKILQEQKKSPGNVYTLPLREGDLEIKIADDHFWISFDSLAKLLPFKMSFYLSDESLEIYKQIEQDTGIFPVKEFDV